MSLSEDDKREIREEIWKGLKEFFLEQGLTTAEHSKDHQFVKGWRESIKTVRMASWVTLITTGILSLLGLVWAALRGKL